MCFVFLWGYFLSLWLIRNLLFLYDIIGLIYVIIWWDKIVKNNVLGFEVFVFIGNRLWFIDFNIEFFLILVKLENVFRILKCVMG